MNLSLFSVLFPNSCALCKREIGPRLQLCDKCIPPSKNSIDECCVHCGEHGEENCLNCRLFPLPNVYLRSLWNYADGIERLIKALKYAGTRSLSSYFAQELYLSIRAGIFLPERRFSWDLIIPAPSLPSTLAKRGYGHMTLVSEKLAALLRIKHSRFILQTRGYHPTQASLKSEDRLKHMNRKFESKPVYGKKILLIDDVITSGATVLGCCLALKKAGATSVDVLTVARTDLFSKSRLHLYERIPKTFRSHYSSNIKY